tara:strand:+ start:15189 stop:15443 length:255 start_codon:yes stop_codon:yes gene_type:complete
MAERPIKHSMVAKARLQRRAKEIANGKGKLMMLRPNLPKLALLYFARHASPEQLEEVIRAAEKDLNPRLQRTYMGEVEQDIFLT